MFGIGFPELIIIVIVALVVFGPSKLPELAGSIGRALRDMKRMADDVKESIESEMSLEENQEPTEEKNATEAPSKDSTEALPYEVKPGEEDSEIPSNAEKSDDHEKGIGG